MEITVHYSKGIFTPGGPVSFQARSKVLVRLVFLGLLIITLFASFHPVPGIAQAEIDRKVKSKVAATYPEIARRMGLTGLVKIQVVVAANGTVKETKVLGGHPILVNAALTAVKKWKFETASGETTGTVEFKFDPGS